MFPLPLPEFHNEPSNHIILYAIAEEIHILSYLLIFSPFASNYLLKIPKTDPVQTWLTYQDYLHKKNQY